MEGTFYPDNDYRNYLMHFGVKGMKWGIRKSRGANVQIRTAGRKKKGFWKQRKENFHNMRRYNRMESEARKKYNLDRLRWEADNEDARNTAARAMTNETLSRMGSYKGMSPDYNPYGTKARDTYRKAKADAARYADDTYKRKYGAERLAQAKRSQTAYDSLAFLASLGLLAGSSAYSAKKKR